MTLNETVIMLNDYCRANPPVSKRLLNIAKTADFINLGQDICGNVVFQFYLMPLFGQDFCFKIHPDFATETVARAFLLNALTTHSSAVELSAHNG